MSDKFTIDGMPAFIDTSGYLSPDQKQDIFRRLAALEVAEEDNRHWLRSLQENINSHESFYNEWLAECDKRIEELYEIKQDKKPWWKVW